MFSATGYDPRFICQFSDQSFCKYILVYCQWEISDSSIELITRHNGTARWVIGIAYNNFKQLQTACIIFIASSETISVFALRSEVKAYFKIKLRLYLLSLSRFCSSSNHPILPSLFHGMCRHDHCGLLLHCHYECSTSHRLANTFQLIAYD